MTVDQHLRWDAHLTRLAIRARKLTYVFRGHVSTWRRPRKSPCGPRSDFAASIITSDSLWPSSLSAIVAGTSHGSCFDFIWNRVIIYCY